MRNANDAISMLQTADGALGVIDEKLIRMKGLAEQAATGTYDSTQRLMIHSEFQAMASEIDRIAKATDFNGIKLPDGSLSGNHDGSGLNATGAMKIHFGSANDSAEDYYYVQIGDCTLARLGLRDPVGATINIISGDVRVSVNANGAKAAGPGSNLGHLPILGEVLINGGAFNAHGHSCAFAFIPQGAENVRLHLDDFSGRDGLELFIPSGSHVAETTFANLAWITQSRYEMGSGADIPMALIVTWAITPQNGFNDDAVFDNSQLNGILGGGDVTFTPGTDGNMFSYNGMNIGYSGEGNWLGWGGDDNDYMTIDRVIEDLILCWIGDGS